MKKYVIIVLLLVTAFFSLGNQKVSAATTSNQDFEYTTQTLRFNVKRTGNVGTGGYAEFETDAHELGYLLENYYEHLFQLHNEDYSKHINIKLRINGKEITFANLINLATNDNRIEVHFVYHEFGVLMDGMILFYYDSTIIESTEAEYGSDFSGHWEMEIPKVVYQDIDDLPRTQTNKPLPVKFAYTGKQLSVEIIDTNKKYLLSRNFSKATDMSLFDTIEAYYIGDNNTKQIVINNGDRPYLYDMIVNPDYVPAFIPHSIWDLNTNELTTLNKYATNVFLKQNKQGVMMSYVYIDAFVIDKMLSAEVAYTTYEKNNWPESWWAGKYTEPERKTITLTSDKYFKYKNKTANWTMMIPAWNGVEFWFKALKTYKMEQITEVNLHNPQSAFNITRNELDSYFRSANGDFNGFIDETKYKVWALPLEQGKNSVFTGKTQTYHNEKDPNDPNNFSIIEIIYETSGKIYSTIGNDMNLIISLDPETGGMPSETNGPGIIATVIFVAVIVFTLMVIYKEKAFTDIKKILGILIIMTLLAVLIFWLWGLFQTGKIFSVVLIL